MEPKNTQAKTPSTQMGSTPGQTGHQTGASTTGTTGGQATGTATARQQTSGRTEPVGQEQWNEMKERGAEFADKAKQTFNEAYERTSHVVNDSYGRAIDYGSEHPGQTMLIAFGVGVCVGVWLSSNVSSRSRSSRIVPPVMNALSEIAAEMFR